MKNECDIVGDLLFSYHDGVLSNSSKELVEEHLAKCEKCKTILAELTQEDTKKSQTKEVDFLKRIQKSSNKKNILIAVVCILFFVLVLFHLLVYNNYYEIASTMEVYLDNDITEQQIEDIKNKIIENSYNLELEYVSKEAAQNRIKDNLGETYDLNKYFDNTIRDSLHRDDFEKDGNQFSLYHIRMVEGAVKHELHFCASTALLK